jgi:hypothetical protein
VGGDFNINYYIQNGQSSTLAGISLLNISKQHFNESILEKDLSQSYHPNLARYLNDPIPLLWSRNLVFTQPSLEEIKILNQKRTESKIGKGRQRGRQIKVYCEAIGKGKFVIKAYQEAIEWFGSCDILGLKEAEYIAIRTNEAPKWFKPHQVTVKIIEGDSYRSISAPISASNNAELAERIEQIKQLSLIHQKIKLKRQ